MIKKARIKLDEHIEKQKWGKGTVMLNTMKELDKVFDEFRGQLVSPGTAAANLGVSRAYVNQLEKEGRITAYRIYSENVNWDELPLKWKLFVAVKDVYIYIPVDDIERISQELIEKTEKKLKKLRAARKK